MIEAVRCPRCHNDVADAPLCSVCCHSLAEAACSCLWCQGGVICSDRQLAMAILEVLYSARDDLEVGVNLGVAPVISEFTAERVQRALAALEG